MSLIPDECIDPAEPRRIPLPLYGMTTWRDLFNDRQLISILAFFECAAAESVTDSGDEGLNTAVQTLLILSASKMIDRNSSLCRWISQNEAPGYTFARQALPMLWDFAESNLLESGGGWDGVVQDSIKVLENLRSLEHAGAVSLAAAQHQVLPDDSADFVFTDPPYYFSIPYANLSDFFYVWLKRFIPTAHAAAFRGRLTSKKDEVIQNLPHKRVAHLQKDRAFYENAMLAALSEAARVAKPEALGTVVFAHTETEAWEALLGALIGAGWCVTASWPIDTERGARVLAQRQSTLGSSVHLVCRPRASVFADAPEIGDWRDVLDALPRRIHEWLPRLAREGVVGADAIFACLGPALEVYSRYSVVEKPSGEVVSLKTYLEHVWSAVSKEALSMIFEGADSTGFEEDARLTAMWLWTLHTAANSGDSADEESQAVRGYSLQYDAARKIAQGLGAHLDALSELVEVRGSDATLLSAGARARHLFGSSAVASRPRRLAKKADQMLLDFDSEVQDLEAQGENWVVGRDPGASRSVLDRVHQAMILFGAGRTEALRLLLVEEGVGLDSSFWSLAQALGALYPTGTEDRRWVEGVLARKRVLGL